MNNRILIKELIGQLDNILERLEAVYKAEVDSARYSTHTMRPANDDVSEISIACEAIDDAINALTRKLEEHREI